MKKMEINTVKLTDYTKMKAVELAELYLIENKDYSINSIICFIEKIIEDAKKRHNQFDY
nr:hypothetical protein [Brevibacillus laterosporus]